MRVEVIYDGFCQSCSPPPSFTALPCYLLPITNTNTIMKQIQIQIQKMNEDKSDL